MQNKVRWTRRFFAELQFKVRRHLYLVCLLYSWIFLLFRCCQFESYSQPNNNNITTVYKAKREEWKMSETCGMLPRENQTRLNKNGQNVLEFRSAIVGNEHKWANEENRENEDEKHKCPCIWNRFIVNCICLCMVTATTAAHRCAKSSGSKTWTEKAEKWLETAVSIVCFDWQNNAPTAVLIVSKINYALSCQLFNTCG